MSGCRSLTYLIHCTQRVLSGTPCAFSVPVQRLRILQPNNNLGTMELLHSSGPAQHLGKIQILSRPMPPSRNKRADNKEGMRPPSCGTLKAGGEDRMPLRKPPANCHTFSRTLVWREATIRGRTLCCDTSWRAGKDAFSFNALPNRPKRTAE